MAIVIMRNISNSRFQCESSRLLTSSFLSNTSEDSKCDIIIIFKARLIMWQLKSKKRHFNRERARSQREKLDPKKGHLFVFIEFDTINQLVQRQS
jgi:hypothetical protein